MYGVHNSFYMTVLLSPGSYSDPPLDLEPEDLDTLPFCAYTYLNTAEDADNGPTMFSSSLFIQYEKIRPVGLLLTPAEGFCL